MSQARLIYLFTWRVSLNEQSFCELNFLSVEKLELELGSIIEWAEPSYELLGSFADLHVRKSQTLTTGPTPKPLGLMWGLYYLTFG